MSSIYIECNLTYHNCQLANLLLNILFRYNFYLFSAIAQFKIDGASLIVKLNDYMAMDKIVDVMWVTLFCTMTVVFLTGLLVLLICFPTSLFNVRLSFSNIIISEANNGVL